MKQQVFQFVRELVVHGGLPLDPRVEEELVVRMSEAILAIIEAERGEKHEESTRESKDHAGAP